MKKFMLVVFSFLWFLVQPSFAASLTFPDITQPAQINVANNRLYVTEGTAISVFSLPDGKLIRKFGRSGEGPQEFKLNTPGGSVAPVVTPQYIFVRSSGKISWFSADGQFIREQKTTVNAISLLPVGKNFAAYFFSPAEGRKMREAVAIYNEKLEKSRVICMKGEVDFVNVRIFPKNISFVAVAERIFVSGDIDFNIDVFDASGEPLPKISINYEKRKVTEPEKEAVINRFKAQNIWESTKSSVVFPDVFPAVRKLMTDGKNVWAVTYKENTAGIECLIFSPAGKLLRTVHLPLKKQDELQFYPMAAENDVLYQLAENERTEQFELVITKL